MERLYRSRSDRFIAGVAGGMADYFHIDPMLVRLLWVAAALLHGIGVLLYLVAMVVIPERGWEGGPREPNEPREPNDARGAGEGAAERAERGQAVNDEERSRRRQSAIGWVLVAVGAFFLAQLFVPYAGWDFLFPLVMVGIGVVLLVGRR